MNPEERREHQEKHQLSITHTPALKGSHPAGATATSSSGHLHDSIH